MVKRGESFGGQAPIGGGAFEPVRVSFESGEGVEIMSLSFLEFLGPKGAVSEPNLEEDFLFGGGFLVDEVGGKLRGVMAQLKVEESA